MGHSMGGGAIFIAANLKSSVDAIVALSPLKTKPSSVQAASSVKVPTLIIAGSNDCITPPDEHQVPIFNFFCQPGQDIYTDNRRNTLSDGCHQFEMQHS